MTRVHRRVRISPRIKVHQVMETFSGPVINLLSSHATGRMKIT